DCGHVGGGARGRNGMGRAVGCRLDGAATGCGGTFPGLVAEQTARPSRSAYRSARKLSWQDLHERPTSPKAFLIAAWSPSAATLASWLAAAVKSRPICPALSRSLKNSGFRRVLLPSCSVVVSGLYSAPMPELAIAAMALAAAA